jgi:hypothetical protein
MKRLFAIACLCLGACSNPSPDISEQIAQAFIRNDGAPIDLALFGPPSWERICVLGPYTSNDGAEAILGFRWNSESKTSIGANDGVTVLVFVRGDEVLAYAEHPRSKGDFIHMKPSCLPRSHAKVARRAKLNGWVFLLALGQPDPLEAGPLQQTATPPGGGVDR